MRSGEAHDFTQLVVAADQLGNRLRQVGGLDRRCGLRCGCGRAGVLVPTRRQNADLAGELVTPSRDRADQVAVRPEDLAQRHNLGLQIVFLDDPVGPDARH